jgi:hypothetical protein
MTAHFLARYETPAILRRRWTRCAPRSPRPRAGATAADAARLQERVPVRSVIFAVEEA